MLARRSADLKVRLYERPRLQAHRKVPLSEPEAPASNGKRDLKAEAMSSAAVQAVLDVFPGEIKDVEEL